MRNAPGGAAHGSIALHIKGRGTMKAKRNSKADDWENEEFRQQSIESRTTLLVKAYRYRPHTITDEKLVEAIVDTLIEWKLLNAHGS
jgi:hypothetical protein